MDTMLWVVALAPIAFVQNMAFTFVSRSRNSGDPRRHARAAIASNGIWLVCNGLVMRGFWSFFNDSAWVPMIAMAVVYTAATTCGSVFMMKANLRHFEGRRGPLGLMDRVFGEAGKSKVAAR